MKDRHQKILAQSVVAMLNDILTVEALEQLAPQELEHFAERCAHWLRIAVKINRERKSSLPTALSPKPK